MGELRNIEIFNSCVGVVLAKLYAEFPCPVRIDTGRDVASRIEGYEGPKDAFSDDPACATICWLINENYIRNDMNGDSSDGPVFIRLLLTSKGLQLLSMPSSLQKEGNQGKPESLEKYDSIGTKMNQALVSGAMDALRELAKRAVMLAPGLAQQALFYLRS